MEFNYLDPLIQTRNCLQLTVTLSSSSTTMTPFTTAFGPLSLRLFRDSPSILASNTSDILVSPLQDMYLID